MGKTIHNWTQKNASGQLIKCNEANGFVQKSARKRQSEQSNKTAEEIHIAHSSLSKSPFLCKPCHRHYLVHLAQCWSHKCDLALSEKVKSIALHENWYTFIPVLRNLLYLQSIRLSMQTILGAECISEFFLLCSRSAHVCWC